MTFWHFCCNCKQIEADAPEQSKVKGKRMTGTFFITISIMFALVNSFQLTFMEYSRDLEDDERIAVSSSSSFCEDNYPYTYSKCIRLCSSELNSTCLDDQLCYCNSNELIRDESKRKIDNAKTLNDYLGTEWRVSCHFSDFCQDLCKYDGRLNDVMRNSIEGAQNAIGALCKLPKRNFDDEDETEACVCKL